MVDLFTPAGCRDLLEAAREGGYRFERFGSVPGGEGTVYLRHDIDKSLAYAVEVAEIEARLGIQATYLLLLHCPLYSLLEPESQARVERIRALGHSIGLHCDERRMIRPSGDLAADVARELELMTELVGPVDRVVSFHNPSEDVIRRPFGGDLVSTYAPEWFPPRVKYLSDSNRRFREGDPRPALRARRWSVLQMLLHPIWHVAPEPDALSALEACAARRHVEIDEYLRYSNHVWANARRSADGE